MSTFAITYGNFNAPAGTVVAGILVTATASGNPANSFSTEVAPGTADVTATLNPDNYTYTIQAVDANKTPIGPALTGTFTVATPAVVSIPVSVIVTP